MLLALILGVTLVRGLIYASVVPPWQSPDEPKHFEYVALLQQEGRLLTSEDAAPDLQADIVASMRRHDFWKFSNPNVPETQARSFADVWLYARTELDRPPFFYLGAALFSLPFKDASVDLLLYIVRLYSVVLSMLTVLFAFLVVRIVFPRDRLLAATSALFVAFLPTQTFIAGSINSDNMANTLAAALAYVLAKCFRQGISPGKILWGAFLIIAGLWTKRTEIFALPLVAIAIPVYLYGNIRGILRRAWLRPAGLAVLLAAVPFVFFEGLRDGFVWVLDHYFFNASAASNLSQFTSNDYTMEALFSLYGTFSNTAFDSFWAQFGWMNVRMDDPWYTVLAAASLLSLGGLLYLGIRIARREIRMETWQIKILGVYAVWVLLVIVVAYLPYTATFSVRSQPQGRYLFTALVPLASLFVLGLRSLLPKPLQPALFFTTAGGLFLLDTVALALTILPSYYQLG